jgi:hypothetical protein
LSDLVADAFWGFLTGNGTLHGGHATPWICAVAKSAKALASEVVNFKFMKAAVLMKFPDYKTSASSS